jgi:cyclomaltodextrinase / maltogenic alpha-amylase / neopullulanase
MALFHTLRQQTIYQVFVRNHTKQGTFEALKSDLPRLQALGISILYLLPIHPIGVVARKGQVGSPYAIQDYERIDPSLGTEKELKALIEEAHRRGIKVMMDVVFNHTARDARWVKEHPEFYYYKDGNLANRVGDWSDVADLDFRVPALQQALIEVLVHWTKFGFDGFRCDVAPLIPLAFWQQAKMAVNAINPNMIWFSESVHPQFIQYLRAQGYLAQSDAEMYQVFDILYDYDVHPYFLDYLQGKGDLITYLRMVQAQGYMYPSHYVKAHFLENHDVARIAALVPSLAVLKNLTAWSFFQPGIGFVYAGQETLQTKTPSLFEKDPVNLTITDESFYNLIARLIQLKKSQIFGEATKFEINLHPLQANFIEATLSSPSTTWVGLFNLNKGERLIHTHLPDGQYQDTLSLQMVEVKQGILRLDGPLILAVKTNS